MAASDLVKFESLLSVGDNGCWVWTGWNARGYGYFRAGGRMNMAHRYSYELHRAEIPEGLVIDHLCRNKACVNPWHLEPVTQRVNVQRGEAGESLRRRRGGMTECRNGHPFDDDNTRVDKRGRRSCKACYRVYDRERKRALREFEREAS